jgi:hypothetical protein
LLDLFYAEAQKLNAIHLPELAPRYRRHSTAANWLQISLVTNGQRSVEERRNPILTDF